MISFVCLLFSFSAAFAQNKAVVLTKIRQEFRAVNSDRGLKEIVLNNEEFLDHMPDGGGKLTGFYKNGQLKKMICWIGLSFGTETFEYYFKDNKLIFIYGQFNTFSFDKKNQKLKYNTTAKTFEGRYYFDGGKLIDHVTKGESRFEKDHTDPEKTLLKEAEEYRRVLALQTKKK